MGRGVRLSGENNVTLPLGNFDRFEPFSPGLVDQDARFQGSRGDHPPLDVLDRRRQPGLSALDRRRQAQRRLDPLLAGQCDRHSCPRSSAAQPVGPRGDHLRRLEPGQRAGALRRRPTAPRARSSATISPRTSRAEATIISPSASGSATVGSRTAWLTRSRSSTAR